MWWLSLKTKVALMEAALLLTALAACRVVRLPLIRGHVTELFHSVIGLGACRGIAERMSGAQ